MKRSLGDNLGIVALGQKDYEAARKYFLEGLFGEYEIGTQHTLIYDMIGLAGLAMNLALDRANEMDARRAVRLASAAESHLTSIGAPMEPIIRRLFERVLKETKTILGEETFSQVWDKGRAMTLEEILEYGREE